MPEGTDILGLPVSSCILTKFVPTDAKGEKGKPIVRPYTPISDDGHGYFDLGIYYLGLNVYFC